MKMKKRKYLAIIPIILGVFIYTWVKSNPDYKASKHVIEDWFAAMKDGNVTLAGTYLAHDFVSLHTDGITRNKSEELTLIKNLHMQGYRLSGFKFSQSGDVIVVTFKDQGIEKIDNRAIGSKPAGRMAVLQKIDDKWEIVAYANLDTIG
jgi:hypothetical protein